MTEQIEREWVRFVLRVLFVAGIASVGLSVITGGADARHRTARKRRKKIEKVAPIRHARVEKQVELAHLKSEIAKVREQLREHELREKASKKNLGAFNKRTRDLQRVIASLEVQEAAIEAERSQVADSISKASSDLSALKSAYASSVQNFYKHEMSDSFGATGSDGKLEREQFQQSEAERRNSYYAYLVGTAHGMNHARLDSTKSALTSDKEELSQTLHAQAAMIEQRAAEQSTVEEERQAEEKRLVQIQANKQKLKRELQQRMASERKLESLIANLVTREESASRERERTKTKRGTHLRHAPESEAPETADLPGTSHPHSLRWPVSGHHILEGYGEHRNRQLNTVTMNLGIDIAAGEGSAVEAAASGLVSLVATLPGYGTIVVLRHPGGLHTVYADLTAATVSRGSSVRAGERIGRSGSNSELGPSLHFEVWKGKSKQNPMGWLR